MDRPHLRPATRRDARLTIWRTLSTTVIVHRMSYVMGDIEADGPIPGDYSMVSLGAVIVEPGLARSY